MNRAILETDLEEANWLPVAATNSNSSTWAFDRWRLYTANWATRVKITDTTGNTTHGIKLFHAGGGWTADVFEHDFTFDLSFNTGNSELLVWISAIPTGANFTQVYANPTGFGATRNKDADITKWYLNHVNPSDWLRLENQPLSIITFAPVYSETKMINALNVRVDNTPIGATYLEDILKWCDANGKSNGTINYSGCANASNMTAEARPAYDNLINKGWTITGTAPPIV
jgi:hypothetical protein